VSSRKSGKEIVVPALRAEQRKGISTFALFLPGSTIIQIAEISRISRDQDEKLKGFQRKEIRAHVNSIVEYLDQGDVLFPNAIILAFGEELEFKQNRGPKGHDKDQAAMGGKLHIPLRSEGERLAWIVDGQQRSLALSKTSNQDLLVPVVAFVCHDLEIQREQFILVNKAKPLPTRLINELLPEVDTLLPRDLSARKLPSELCNLLNRDPNSPFHDLIKRMSVESDNAVITDSAVEKAIQKSLRPPYGALVQFKGFGSEQSDTEAMYQTLVTYWSAVKQVFGDAWGLPSTKSRLMHSAGIRSMSVLMDQIMMRADMVPEPGEIILEALQRLKPHCHWTDGVWEGLGWQWNEIQSTPTHINRLSEHLTRLDKELSRRSA
jgi:DGQHR domain-containing protein